MGLIRKNDTLALNNMRRPPRYKKTGLPEAGSTKRILNILKRYRLHTVCEEAKCPNKGECFSAGVATIMILGNICTRGCAFCGVTGGIPLPVEPDEPERVGLALRELNLDYVVITSVTRDDLQDGGAGVFYETVKMIRKHSPATKVEILIPDFNGDESALNRVIDSEPYCISHNIETVRRLYKSVRPGADYDRSLELLRKINSRKDGISTKSGFMLGLGEKNEEIEELMYDLRDVKVKKLVIGQYLRPSHANVPVSRYYTEEEFKEWGERAKEMGFESVLSEPLARTSYHATV